MNLCKVYQEPQNSLNSTTVPDRTPATQHNITYSGLKPTTLTDCAHYSKHYPVLISDIYNLHFI